MLAIIIADTETRAAKAAFIMWVCAVSLSMGRTYQIRRSVVKGGFTFVDASLKATVNAYFVRFVI